ncbi:MAG: tetratricopeptide repeat protein [wastewater metagenome]|nr:tetratricopeptide repeat protein [Candidatus Loosdrechtia aerotolerans]
MKRILKELFYNFKTTTKNTFSASKKSFVKTDKQMFVALGAVFVILIITLVCYWFFKEKPYYTTLLAEKDELIKTLKFTRDKQKKIYENALDAYEKKLAEEYISKSVYDLKVSEYEQELNLYKTNYISHEDHENQIKLITQQLKEDTQVETTEDTSKEEAEKKIIALEHKISLLEDKNLSIKTSLEKSLSFIKGEKETWENMLLLERKKALIPSLILPETKPNALRNDLFGKLVVLKDTLRNIAEMNISLRSDTYFEMGLISYYNKQYDEAIEQWENAISLNKNDMRAYICLGIVYNEKGMSKNAIKILNHAVEFSPQYSTLHLTLARIYEQRDALDNAIYEYSRVLEIDPQAIDTYNIIGRLYERKGLKEEARKAFAQYETLKNK